MVAENKKVDLLVGNASTILFISRSKFRDKSWSASSITKNFVFLYK